MYAFMFYVYVYCIYLYSYYFYINAYDMCACMVRDGGITLKYIITLALKSAYVYVIDVN